MSGIPARPTRPTPPIPEEEGKRKVSKRSPTPGVERVRRWGRGSSEERDEGQGRGEVFSAFGKNKKPDPA